MYIYQKKSAVKKHLYSIWTFIIGLALLFTLTTSCQEEEKIEKKNEKEIPSGEPKYEQYGTPYDNVPVVGDVAMYEVNPKVFSISGDLDGITGRLKAIKDLGINVVWLMPIYQTGAEKSVGSPYAIKDYKSILPEYGDLEDLRELVDRAHELDMAVILDWVANHTAWDHSWINEHPTWYTRDNAGNIIIPPGTNWQDVAELNYNNSEMRLEMIDAMKYWVLEANVDGFRCDYATGVPYSFWNQAIDTLRNIPERELIMFAETDDKQMLINGFNLIFGWSFYAGLIDVFDGGLAHKMDDFHTNEYKNVPVGKHVVRWVTNHDEHAWNATPQDIFGGLRASVSAFVLCSYMGGVPLVYNGQEVGVSNQLPFFEGTNMTINWSSNTDIQDEYAKLLSFRQSSEVVRKGEYASITENQDVVSFKKTLEGISVYVIVNTRNRIVEFSLPDDLSDNTFHEIVSEEEVTFGSNWKN